MNRQLRSTLIAALSLISTSALGQKPRVLVTGGLVEGRPLAAGGAVFKGIPFAAPPVGALRWRAPQPVARWQGVRDASRFGPSCMQEIHDWNRQEATGQQEDCLYLNVWTPATKPGAKTPVMVWIHGGGNTGGGASVDYFDGASLAGRGVVLVTINYRLGLLGFLAHPALTAESPHKSSGDYGLMDTRAALEWVHANIARFGGDPANVTVFGQSAGGGNTAAILASPRTRGLFQRAILQSSAVRDYPSFADAQATGEAVVARFGEPAGAPGIAALRALPAAELQKRYDADAAMPRVATSADNWYLPATAAPTFAAGRQNRVPVMIGSMSQEQNGPKGEALRKAIDEAYGVNAGKALAFYGLDKGGEGRTDPLYGTASKQVQADTLQRCGAVQQAIWLSAAGMPVFEYQATRAIPGRPVPSHSSELPYVFGNLLPGGFLGGPFGPLDRTISDQMQLYWTNFARTGNPNGGGLPRWEPFDASKRAYLEFTDAGPVMKAGLRREICDLYMDALAAKMARPAG